MCFCGQIAFRRRLTKWKYRCVHMQRGWIVIQSSKPLPPTDHKQKMQQHAATWTQGEKEEEEEEQHSLLLY